MTSRNAARRFRLESLPPVSTMIAITLTTSPITPNTSSPWDGISAGSNRRETPSITAYTPTPSRTRD